MNKRIERLTALALLLVCAAIAWSQLDAYSHAQTSSSGSTALGGGPTAPCASTLKTKYTAVTNNRRSFQVDTGTTRNYYTACQNLSRSYFIGVRFNPADTDPALLSPNGGSLTNTVAGGATSGSCYFDTQCASCGGAASYANAVSCPAP